ncbi:MFS transporter [Dactylosporangium sp. CA-233914]|uniref:MFS transporter n=1 Tax=Dactylosporangium sp. CA-233914 TaxID=3239934 RepID=UPI003D8A53CD
MKSLVDLRPIREFPLFRRLWLGSTASGLGSHFTSFAVVYYVWTQSHNPALVGLVGLASAVPLVTIALVGSAVIDHIDRRRLALTVTAGQAVTSLLMVLVAASAGRNGIWLMLGLTSVASALSGLGNPVLRSVVPGLLPADRLAAGLALNHLSFQVTLLLGPVLAGAVTAAWGTTWCFVIDAASFLAALAGIAGLPRAGAAPASGRRGFPAIRDGLRFAAGTPVVRGALLADLAATVLAMPMAVFPVISDERYGGSPQVLGLLTTAVAVGGVAASAFSGVVTGLSRPGRAMVACGAVWAVALALAGAVPQLAVVLVMLAVAGAADTWAVVCRGTLVQSATPESLRGRISAAEHIVGVAGPQIGGLRAGLVAAGTSGGAALLLGGLTSLAAVGLIAVTTPGLLAARAAAVGEPAEPERVD